MAVVVCSVESGAKHNCLADVLRAAFIVYTMVLHIWHACQALLTSVICSASAEADPAGSVQWTLIAPLQCHSAAQIMGTVHSTQVTIKATYVNVSRTQQHHQVPAASTCSAAAVMDCQAR